MLCRGTPMLVVNAKVPANSVKELIALAKAEPGKLNYGSYGVGTYAHLSMEDFKQRTGTDIVHIPYRGATPAAQALLAGDVNMLLLNLSSIEDAREDRQGENPRRGRRQARDGAAGPADHRRGRRAGLLDHGVVRAVRPGQHAGRNWCRRSTPTSARGWMSRRPRSTSRRTASSASTDYAGGVRQAGRPRHRQVGHADQAGRREGGLMLVPGALSGIAAVTLCLAVLPAAAQSPMRQQAGEGCEPPAGFVVECVRPSATDPRIHRADSDNYVLTSPRPEPDAKLLLFMPGTGGEPPGPRAFLRGGGRRRLPRHFSRVQRRHLGCGLLPRKTQSGLLGRVPRHAHLWRPNIGGRIRRQHTGGIDRQPAGQAAAVSRSQTPGRRVAELSRKRPAELGTNCRDRAVARGGHGCLHREANTRSARVILFSSPWDYVETGGRREVSSLAGTCRARHRPGAGSAAITRAKTWPTCLPSLTPQLKIPRDHIRVFNQDLPAGNRPKGKNPFHGQGINNQAYAKQWAFFLQAPER